jgi:serine/threonine-protein kinase RsbW
MDSFVVPAKLDSLSDIRDHVNKAASLAGLGVNAAYKLVLAIDEIATNIITYGYEEHGLSGNIQMLIEKTDSELIVTLEDNAVHFDPKAHELPTEGLLAKPLEDRQIGGLGVYLTITGVDRFDYEYVDNKNRNILAMKLGGNKQ